MFGLSYTLKFSSKTKAAKLLILLSEISQFSGYIHIKAWLHDNLFPPTTKVIISALTVVKNTAFGVIFL